jgi:hypothetical protein
VLQNRSIAMPDLVRIIIRSSDPQELRTIIATEELDLACGGATQAESGEWQVEAYVSPEVAERLRAEGHRVDVDTQAMGRAAARRSEVSTDDRFEGGRVPPRGLGRKE